jgi:hypothetical protein
MKWKAHLVSGGSPRSESPRGPGAGGTRTPRRVLVTDGAGHVEDDLCWAVLARFAAPGREGVEE